MTYSAYGYCSWDCLMNVKKTRNNQNRVNRKNNGYKSASGQRSR